MCLINMCKMYVCIMLDETREVTFLDRLNTDLCHPTEGKILKSVLRDGD